jgi:hypothetical protein
MKPRVRLFVGPFLRPFFAGALLLVLGCGSGGSSGAAANPCVTLCNKANTCRAMMGSSILNCAAGCVYGGDLLPGLAPTPSCANTAQQEACVEAAVQMSCANEAYLQAAAACATCGVLDGSACADDADCQRYDPSYRCDLSRAGGYCTKACGSADDCSAVGPEECNAVRPPSFAPQALPNQGWCVLGCKSDGDCRAAEGYKCTAMGCDILSP